MIESREINVGLKEILTGSDYTSKIVTVKICKATDVIRAMSENGRSIANGVVSRKTTLNTMPMDENLLKIVRKYGERILLKESDLLPKKLKKKTRRRVSSNTMNTNKQLVCSADWQGPPPWDSSLGGDGCPKFLLDVMVIGSISVDLGLLILDFFSQNERANSFLDLVFQFPDSKQILV